MIGNFKNYKAKSRKRIYCGASGGGKTTLAIADIHAALKQYDYVFVFDDEGQFADRLPAYLCTTEDECVRAIAGKFVCFNPDEMFDDTEAGFKWFCEWVFNFSCAHRGTKLMVFDELQTYLDTHPARWLTHPFAKCCGKGRWRGLDVFAICPTISELNPKFRNQITEIVAFQHEDERAAEHVLSKGIALEKLKALRDGEFFTWTKRREKNAPAFRPGKVVLK